MHCTCYLRHSLFYKAVKTVCPGKTQASRKRDVNIIPYNLIVLRRGRPENFSFFIILFTFSEDKWGTSKDVLFSPQKNSRLLTKNSSCGCTLKIRKGPTLKGSTSFLWPPLPLAPRHITPLSSGGDRKAILCLTKPKP